MEHVTPIIENGKIGWKRTYSLGICYYNENLELHRDNDLPAIENCNTGTKQYYINGKLHRDNGRAIEFTDGTGFYYFNGLKHRTDGPAAEYPNGSKIWYLNGFRHRVDGPAIEHSDGTKKHYYINGQELTEEEFNESTKVKT